jgi:cytochrome c551/c552
MRALYTTIALMVFGFAATANPQDAPTAQPKAALERGELLWDQNECTDCHENPSEPGQIVIGLDHIGKKFNELTLAAFLASPPALMPNPKLGEADRLALAKFLLDKYR